MNASSAQNNQSSTEEILQKAHTIFVVDHIIQDRMVEREMRIIRDPTAIEVTIERALTVFIVDHIIHGGMVEKW